MENDISKQNDKSTSFLIDKNYKNTQKNQSQINDNEENELFNNSNASRSQIENISIIKNYVDNLHQCEEKIKIFQTLGYIAFLIFLILFFVKSILENNKNYGLSYYILLIPAILGIVFFTIGFNYFLRIKHLFEMEESRIIKEDYEECNSYGNFFAYFFLNLLGILFCVFLILVAIKLQSKNTLTLNVINSPMYVSIAIMACYLVYTIPALILNRFYWGLFLMISYLLNFLIFFVFSTMKFDYGKSFTFTEWFIPLYVALILHLAYSVYELICGENSLLHRILFFISISIFLVAVIYTGILLDNKEYNKGFVSILFFLIAYILLIIEKISLLIYGNGEHKDENNHIKC